MSKLLVVFGATGQQGGSVVDFVLNHPDLSKKYKIRGVTRDTAGSGAKALQAKGVETVQADAEAPETLKAALHGAQFVFSNTASVYDDKLYDREVSSGKAIADATVAAGAEYIIYSSSTATHKYVSRPVYAFDCKAVVEDYIRTLPIKSAFFTAGAFMVNWHTQQKPRPTETPGEYAIHNILDPQTQIPAFDTVGDTGKYVGAILNDPDKYEGKILAATSEMITLPQVAAAISNATGKSVKYIQHPEQVWASFLPESMRELLVNMMAYFDEPGYYGTGTKEKVEWSQQQALGKLTTYEEFLRRNPINLD